MNIDHVNLNRTFRVGLLNDAAQDALVRRAKSGDSDAFARLYDHYVDEIYRYVYFLLMDQTASEDLTARVFLKAWNNLDRFELGEESFGAWLFVLASGEVSRKRGVNAETTSTNEIIAFASAEPQAGAQNELLIEADSLQEALRTLSQDQQNIVVLKFISGMSTDDIANQLGQSPKSVRALQRKALQSLARHYGYSK